MAIDCFTVSPLGVASYSYLVDTRIEQTMRRFISKRLIAVPDLVDIVDVLIVKFPSSSRFEAS